MRARLSTMDGLCTYVDEQLSRLPDDWGAVRHAEEGDGCLWNLQPSRQDTFDASRTPTAPRRSVRTGVIPRGA